MVPCEQKIRLENAAKAANEELTQAISQRSGNMKPKQFDKVQIASDTALKTSQTAQTRLNEHITKCAHCLAEKTWKNDPQVPDALRVTRQEPLDEWDDPSRRAPSLDDLDGEKPDIAELLS